MKKKLNVLLLLVVAGLWGTVMYRFINNYFFPKEVAEEGASYKNIAARDLNIKRDTFLLMPLQRDPFLNRAVMPAYPRAASSGSYKHRNPKPVEQPAQIIVYWPEIEYYGYIKSGKNEEFVVVKINGSMSRMHKGQTTNGILVKNIYKDSIAVIFNKEQRMIKLSK